MALMTVIWQKFYTLYFYTFRNCILFLHNMVCDNFFSDSDWKRKQDTSIV